MSAESKQLAQQLVEDRLKQQDVSLDRRVEDIARRFEPGRMTGWRFPEESNGKA